MKKNLLVLGLLSTVVLAGCGTQTSPTDCSIESTTGCTVETPTPETNSPVTTETPTVENTTTPETIAITGYTLEEVKLHSTQKDCRTAANGKVYDITKAFGNHKGGDDKLMLICGKDGTETFNKMHGESDKAKGVLESLYIGDLK